MTVERIELRKILSQMLADNGINRETLKDIVRECIDERIEKALKNLSFQSDGCFVDLKTKVQDSIDRLLRREVETQARDAVRNEVRQIFSKISVNVELNNPKKGEGERNG